MCVSVSLTVCDGFDGFYWESIYIYIYIFKSKFCFLLFCSGNGLAASHEQIKWIQKVGFIVCLWVDFNSLSYLIVLFIYFAAVVLSISVHHVNPLKVHMPWLEVVFD
ncbi:unnamed protein product [Camellia sinensis]